MTADGWILISPLLLCAGLYLLTSWSAAVFLTARLFNRRRHGLPAGVGVRWLRWGWMLSLSGGAFLLFDLPLLLRRVDFLAVTDSETARAVAVVMGLMYAVLALLIGATLFLLAALETRTAKRTA